MSRAPGRPPFAFRPFLEDDRPLLRRWQDEPHVARWWTDLVEEDGHLAPDDPVQAYVIELDGRPVGYLQAWRVADDASYTSYADLDPGTVGVDMLIGEAGLIGRGLGPVALRSFVDEVVIGEMGATCCLIDPAIENHRAVRAFEKAGFRRVTRVVGGPYGDVEIMVRDAAAAS